MSLPPVRGGMIYSLVPVAIFINIRGREGGSRGDNLEEILLGLGSSVKIL
jgi:hypothetical protein